MTKKQVIKINESQLKQVVTEIVKKMLKEETSDSWQHQDFDFSNACERLCGEIELGNYDNRITDAEWVESMENKYENDNNGTVGNIRKAINDRLSVIASDSQGESQYMNNEITKRIVSESIKKVIKESNDMEVANTILQQLGGRRFKIMTGARDFYAIDNGLQFKLGKNGSRANLVKIILQGDDTYTMQFWRFGNFNPFKVTEKYMKMGLTPEEINSKVEQAKQNAMPKMLKEYTGLFFDQLQEFFTEYTKLYTRL